MRISDWSSDVCSSDLTQARLLDAAWRVLAPGGALLYATCSILQAENAGQVDAFLARTPDAAAEPLDERFRSEEHTSELQSLMRIAYAAFCLYKIKAARYISLIPSPPVNASVRLSRT